MAEFVEHSVAEGIDGETVAHVGDVFERFAAQGADFGTDVLNVFDAAACGDDVGALLGEAEGNGSAEAGGSTGNNGDAAGEVKARQHCPSDEPRATHGAGWALSVQIVGR